MGDVIEKYINTANGDIVQLQGLCDDPTIQGNNTSGDLLEWSNPQ